MARTSPQYIENILLKLSDAAAQVQRVHSPDDVFRTIARHLADLGLRAAVLHLQDPASDRLSVAYSSFPDEQMAQVEQWIGLSLGQIALPAAHILCRPELSQNRQAVLITDTARFLGQLLPKPYPHLCTRIVKLLDLNTVMMAPLVAQDRVVGVFFAAGVALELTDMPVISAFAAQFNMAWENALLYQQIKQHAESLADAVTERTHELEKALRELFVRERHQRDIGQRLLTTNRALQAEKQRTDAILQSVAGGLVVTDLQDRVILINPAAVRLLDVPAESLDGQILSTNPYTNVQRLWRAINSLASGTHSTELDLYRRDPAAEQPLDCANPICLIRVSCAPSAANCEDAVGRDAAPGDCPLYQHRQTLSVQVHRSFVLDEEKHIVGTVLSLTDITRLKELDRLKSQFVSSVSHELRTPLTNIKMYLSLLKNGRPEKRDHYMHIVTAEAERLERLIQDVLDLSRLDAANGKIRLEPVDIAPLIERVVETHLPRAQDRDVQLSVSMDEHMAPCLGNRDQLVQVLTNLLSNALQYTMPGGRVQVGAGTVCDDHWTGAAPLISAMPPGEWGALWIEDTGIGIDPEEQKHIFERFYRGSAERMGIPGTGLGLSIVKEIVQLHNGHVLLNSRPGQGSIFVVLLPLAYVEPRVLVIDDDVDVANLVLHFLREIPCRTEWLADGAAGFARASADPPDLMLLDLNMPGMDGLTLLSLLRTLPATERMPILVMTARHDQDEATLRRLGANGLLTKPFSMKVFLAQVTRLLSTEGVASCL